MSEPLILGIETSCDETAVGIVKGRKLLANVIASSVEEHARFGGVVPEVASRAHLEAMQPTVDKALQDSGIKLKDLDAIAVTAGPGLVGALLVGVSAANALALALNKPLYGVNHLASHVAVDLLTHEDDIKPTIALLVSGGHSSILQVNDITNDIQPLGQTIDDAAGEAFDKSAKLLGLPYPGGPLIDQYAQKGDGNRFKFPKPSIEGLDFSFSGLKTSILYFLQQAGKSVTYKQSNQTSIAEQEKFIADNLPDICASIQQRIISILLDKLEKAVHQTGIQSICLAGGVSANKGLRKEFLALAEKNGWQASIPAFEYCTDNAGMIAITAYYKYKEKQWSELATPSTARANW